MSVSGSPHDPAKPLACPRSAGEGLTADRPARSPWRRPWSVGEGLPARRAAVLVPRLRVRGEGPHDNPKRRKRVLSPVNPPFFALFVRSQRYRGPSTRRIRDTCRYNPAPSTCATSLTSPWHPHPCSLNRLFWICRLVACQRLADCFQSGWPLVASRKPWRSKAD